MLPEIGKAFKAVKLDYNTPNDRVSKHEKMKCFVGCGIHLLQGIGSSITSPFVYPIYYIFRKSITEKLHKGTSWQEIQRLMTANETLEVKKIIKANGGKFLYWLWTYGDIDDPMGRGGMLDDYKNGKNSFWNRFCWSALRNPRFNKVYMDFRTGEIVETIPIIDTRNFKIRHCSPGIGCWNWDGIFFKWMKDNNGKWYFIYEDNNVNHLFYLGYVGLLFPENNNKGGRFETSYRKTEQTIIS